MEQKKSIISPYNSLTNPHSCEGKSINFPHNCEGKKYIFATSDKKLFVCDKCDKSFARQDNLKRHKENYCFESNNNKEIKEMFLLMKEEHFKEKEDLKQQIEVLLTKVGNNNSVRHTTNNINNTIVLNNYGQEDLSHVTDTIKTELLKIPYGMIPKMIEHIHFNEEKPENKNIIITNSRDNKLKIYKNNKWIYRDKTETLNDLVDSKYFIIDRHFDKAIDNEKLNHFQTENYKKFQELIDIGDKELIENIKKECELILLNNR